MDTSAPSPGEFTITLIDEATPTIDGRVFAPGVVEWRDCPLPLMYLTENIGSGEGHKGSKVGASIQEIWRDGTKIKGKGQFSSGPEGIEFKRMVEEGLLNGVSADVGGAILEQELAEDGTPLSRIMQGKIMGATVLPFPAFDNTRIAVVASAVPDEPPMDWFANPNLDGPTPLSITKDGHVFGHAATWGTCHVGKPGQCLTPPRSASNYSYFKTGSVLTADGTSVATGPITLGTGHAGLTLNSTATAEHYDHTGTAIADVVTGEDSYGIWVAGAVRPGVPDERLRALRASALSGDWRNVQGRLELIALLAVNTPGFPIPRTRAAFADESEALTLVAAGVLNESESMTDTTTEEFDWSPQAREAADRVKNTGDRSNAAGKARGPERARQVGAFDQKDKHNNPKSQDNRSDETPSNAKDDADSMPVTEGKAADHRASAGREHYADESVEELSETEVAELTIRVEQLEQALLALAANRITAFAATVELSKSDEEESADDEGDEDTEE